MMASSLPNMAQQDPDAIQPFQANGTASQSNRQGDSPAKRTHRSQPSSKVLHVRNLPPYCTEAELSPFFTAFGPIVRCVLMTANSQALIQMAELQHAEALIASTPTLNVRGRFAFVQFSQHQELKPASESQRIEPTPSKVVLAKVENIRYPGQVNVDVLCHLFTRYGSILRIVSFDKHGCFHALVEMADATMATAALKGLSGQEIYPGSCLLRVSFSRLDHIVVQPGSDRSRDFTQHGAPPQHPQVPVTPPTMGLAPETRPPHYSSYYAPPPPAPGFSPGATPYPQGTNQYPQGTGQYPAPPPPPPPTEGAPLHNSYTHPSSTPPPPALGIPPPPDETPVVIASRLNEHQTRCDHLFTLFGVYGNVMRIKILHKTPSKALIQFENPQQAAMAVQHLNGIPLFGNNLRVSPSVFTHVGIPQTSDGDNTKDYRTSPAHRFRTPGSFKNVFGPSVVLHATRLPQTVTEDWVKEKFKQYGFQVENVKFLPGTTKQALVQFGSVDVSVAALVAMHNQLVDDNKYLRLAFSRHLRLG
eukprot:m.25431 g.25431  ORF g.25431 m.25431 type:complete len:531 (+) comp11598_c0_seq1:25-1617(+)